MMRWSLIKTHCALSFLHPLGKDIMIWAEDVKKLERRLNHWERVSKDKD
jgi:hypothetical protein